MPFDPTDPKYTSPLAAMSQDRLTGMLNQPQLKVFADTGIKDGGTNPVSPIMPGQTQLNRTMGMAKGGAVNDELAGIKDTIRAEFAARGLDFDRFVQNPAVMDEVGKSIQSQGSNGDTILAHINPEEAQLLKEMGGSGTVNPATGLPQFAGADPSGSSVTSSNYSGGSSTSNYTGGSDLGGYGGSGSGSQSWSGGGGSSNTSSMAAARAADRASVSGYTGGDGGSSFGSMAAARAADRGSVAGYTGGDGGVAPILSPMGVGGGSIPMGQRDAQIAQATRPEPSVPSYDLMSGLQIGGASNLSGLGQLAAVPSFTGTVIAPQPTSVDLGNTAPQLSDIDFSNISPGMYQGATMPGGISNFAAAPEDPGYTDIGVTAMRMAAGQGAPGMDRRTGIGQGVEYNFGKLNEFDPVSQTQGATILNRMMDLGYSPGFDRFGVGRTMAQQAELAANAGNNLTAAPGRSMHNFGLAMDVENLPDQGYRDLSRIAQEEGWGWGGSQDPAHVQMAPWGAGAMQTAQRLGASPFTGATQTAQGASPLKEALNTVSNIAGELFGVNSAQAAETPQRDILGEFYTQTEPFGGEEIMSPFVGNAPVAMAFPPRSQEQMLSALGIKPGPTSPTSAAEVAGSGVFPSNAQLGIKFQERAPTAQPNFPPAVEPAIQVSPPLTPMDRFGLPEQMATYGVEQTGPAYPRMGVDAFGPLGPSNLSELTLSAADRSVDNDETLGQPAYPTTEVNPNSYQNYTLNPDFAYQQMLGALGWKSMFAPPKEEAIAKMTSALEQAGSVYDPTTGTVYAQDPATMQKALGVVPIELKDGEGNVVGTINAADFLTPVPTPVKTVPLPPTRMTEAPTALPSAPVGLTSFESALRSSPLAAQAQATAPVLARQEPADPTQSTSPMTTEQLKSLGVYQTPLKEGQTVRQNFSEAYADATKNKIEVFEWTNPATGRTEVYKSGFDEANLPAKTAKPAGGQQAPQTDYERRVEDLENADMIANGMSKEEYAAAMGVPVEQVKTRITTQFGPPMAEYYTKTVFESLAGMTGDEGNMAGALNLMSMFSPLGILGLAGKAGYNAYRKRQENKAEGGYISPLASMGKR